MRRVCRHFLIGCLPCVFLLLLALPLAGCAPSAGPSAAATSAAALLPAALVLSPSGPHIAQGSGRSFTARATFPDGHIKDVSQQLDWSVVDEQGRPVAGATAVSGLITVETPGRYRVRATIGSRVVETPLTVTTATLNSVAISPLTPSLALGTNQQFTLTATFSDGTSQDVTALSAWSTKSVTGSGVALIGATGLVTTKAVGTTRVTGRYSGKSTSTVLTVTPAVLKSLAVSPANPSIAKGTAQQFAATAMFSDGTQQDVTALADWSVQDITGTSVADIDELGHAVGLALGQVAVSANYNGVSGGTTLTVSAATPTSFHITPATSAIAKGTGQAFTATLGFSDGSTQNVTASAAWTATDVTGTGVASIDARGVAISYAVGRATIAATYSGFAANATLDVGPALLNHIEVRPASATIGKGASQRFSAIGVYTDGTESDLSAASTWSASDVTGTGVATVDATGVAIAKNLGKATIRVAYLTASAQATLQVTAPTLDYLGVPPYTVTIGKGMTQQFSALAHFSDGSWQDVTEMASWNGTDLWGKSVASFNSTGLFTGLNDGNCLVTASYGGLTNQALLTVTHGVQAISTGTTQVLRGLWGASASNVWVVGSAGTIMNFDGIGIHSAGTPAGSTNMNAVWGSGASDVWFGGDWGLLLHWNGTAFASQSLSPAPASITGLWGSGAGDIWAATTGGPYHYDGTSWRLVSTGIRAAAQTAVWGSGASDVWFGENGAMEHWDGTSLSTSTLPTAASIQGISGTGARDIWAVGSSGAILHYNGVAWSAVSSPTKQNLVGVAAVGKSDVMIAGDAGTILHSTETGFTTLSSPTTENLLSVFRVGAVAFFTGRNGVFLRGL